MKEILWYNLIWVPSLKWIFFKNTNIYILNTNENNKKRVEISLDTKYTPLINRNIQAEYPAASIFKLVTTTAILNENILSVYDKFYCGGIICVTIDGDVTPCSVIRRSFGNIHNSSLEKIVNQNKEKLLFSKWALGKNHLWLYHFLPQV